jgi:hypothetical protein
MLSTRPHLYTSIIDFNYDILTPSTTDRTLLTTVLSLDRKWKSYLERRLQQRYLRAVGPYDLLLADSASHPYPTLYDTRGDNSLSISQDNPYLS